MAKRKPTPKSLPLVSGQLLALLAFAVMGASASLYQSKFVQAEAEPNLTPSQNAAAPNPVLWGGQITYTYTLINGGTANATGQDVFSELPVGVSNPTNFTFQNCGGAVINSSGGNIVELANVATTQTTNCIVTYQVTVDNPYAGPSTIVNEYFISPAAQGGPEVGPITATTVTPVQPGCGNNIIEPGEQCEDGNSVPNDGCGSTCQLEVCGDGIVQSNEQCDDGNTNNGDGCDASCNIEIALTCGDGTLDQDEACDDGNNVSNDGCNASCELEVCGDGIIQQGIGEQCDDGNTINQDGCSSTCQLDGIGSICGDGVLEAFEQCDDGNTVNGDGCNDQCNVESCAGLPISLNATVPCWAADAVTWVINNQIFPIETDEDVRDAVKFYRLHNLLNPTP